MTIMSQESFIFVFEQHPIHFSLDFTLKCNLDICYIRPYKVCKSTIISRQGAAQILQNNASLKTNKQKTKKEHNVTLYPQSEDLTSPAQNHVGFVSVERSHTCKVQNQNESKKTSTANARKQRNGAFVCLARSKSQTERRP